MMQAIGWRRVQMAALLVLTTAGLGFAQPNPYRLVENWANVPADFKWGTIASVYPGPDNHLWVLQRSDPPVLEFDETDTLIHTFGAGLFVLPHGVYIDRDYNVWVVDSGPFSERGRVEGKGHQIFKFDRAGQVLMTLGKPNVSMAGEETFIGPTGIVMNAAGEIFITDGHTPRAGQQDGDRVVKLSKDGKFIKAWGRKGAGPGELNGPHGIAINAQGHLLVADRDNNRIELFDQDGTYLGHWMHYARPSGIWIDDNDLLFVAHNADPAKTLPGWQFGVRIGSATDGTLTAFIPDDQEGEVVGADHHGNVYVSVGATLKKYVKR